MRTKRRWREEDLSWLQMIKLAAALDVRDAGLKNDPQTDRKVAQRN